MAAINPLTQKSVIYPSKYDSTRLYPIPRSANRLKIGIETFYGVDIWHAYEFSYLNSKGLPVCRILRFAYSAQSPCIVESKSVKLYLFGFSMEQFENDTIVQDIIRKDLSAAVGSDVLVTLFDETHRFEMADISDKMPDLHNCAIDRYDLDPTLLQTEPNSAPNKTRTIVTDLLKTNCPITGQPDWATVRVDYESGSTIVPESFIRYIVSFRNHADYHENCTEQIYADLCRILAPQSMTVQCHYTRRGGIDINPVRYLNKLDITEDLIGKFDLKYSRQ
ncbi:MAG: hypothetical protein IKN25_08910 [Spirochaetales bacterium]|nr:hypothetical protein [Spirochaetales bacterium]